MRSEKVSVTLDERLVQIVDHWIEQGLYPNRSEAIQSALREKLERCNRTRLADELNKLDVRAEQALADDRWSGETWPEY